MYFQLLFSSSLKSCKIEIFEVFFISYFLSDCEDSLSGTIWFVEERVTQFMIKLPHFHNNFVPVQVLKIPFPSINEGISYKIALGVVPPDPSTVFARNQTCWSMSCSCFDCSRHAVVLSQSLINTDFFFCF